MADENSTKKPNKATVETTAEIAAMFNIEAGNAAPVGSHSTTLDNLPVIDAESTPVKAEEAYKEAAKGTEPVFDLTDVVAPIEEDAANNSKVKALRMVKMVAPYIGIFVVGLFLYQYFFSGFSVSDFLKNTDITNAVQSDSEVNDRLQALKVEKAGEYNGWIRQFFYEVSDPELIDMDTDLSGNGLTNFEKFLMNLNPKTYDTLGLGQPDGQTVMDGVNPWTGKGLSENQRKIVELYFDRNNISNRLAAGSLKRSQAAFASANPNSSSQTADFSSASSGANPAIATATVSNPEGAGSADNAQVAGVYTNQPQPVMTASSGGSGGLRNLDINTDVPGQLNIPANKISAPIIFTKNTKDFDRDLTRGVVHYPGTAMPGDAGTAYISGHSSGYSWQKNAYKNVFRGLNNVKDGTSFTITVTLRDNRKATLHYVVQNRQEYAANDQAQFMQTAEPRVALSTCWPLDTSSRRLVVFAKQTQVSF